MKALGIPSGILAFLLLVGSCSQPSVQPAGDSDQIYRIDRFIEKLRSLVERRDAAGLRMKYPKDQQDEMQRISGALERIREPRLDFEIDRVILRSQDVTVELHWEFIWMNSSRAESLTRHGNAKFHLKLSEEIALESIIGDNPFLAPLSEPSVLP